MEQIDSIKAVDLVQGDCIAFDGTPGEIKEIIEEGDDIRFISEDDREEVYSWDQLVVIFGYTEVDEEF